ncbi:rust resistance kinase Lr10-like [Hibiscus syriacus]|uniref:rust resistance kinase Lr10-like n=1 Tax=Hibiscus syriacus TaxID=106335 RepID=UPI001921EE59|nr:rust resistance kinase Lr10-like [Hibiscus syriacus]
MPVPPLAAPPARDFLDRIAFNYTCDGDGEQYRFYLWRNDSRSQRGETVRSLNNFTTPSGCDLVMVPVSYADANNVTAGDGVIELSQLTKALAAGFSLQWNSSEHCQNCNRRNEQCGFVDGASVVCLCDGGCITSTKPRLSQLHKILIGVACGILSIIVIAALLVYKNRASLICLKIQATSDGTNAKEFIKTYRSNLLSNYSYHDIRKITNGFKDKLGAGGYSDVYRGKLFDGRVVAVKLLKSSDIIRDDFVMEVATIGRIHHFNVINLFGFCWDGSKRALVYEYMPNGSLADLLSKEEVKNSLGVEKLMEIAIGVAEGIEYLHNGCESRILHLDIKPQNVLLDQSLNPKISDFGLAKVYSRDRSDVTMTTARGTIGYIAPEIFMKKCWKSFS